MTLADLRRLFAVLPVAAALSRALGYHKTTLHQRIKRGQPELTEEESDQIRAVLERAGLRIESAKS
jgi:hypothetical protein